MKRTLLMKLVKYEIPEQYENRDDVLLCHYCTGWFAVLAIFSVIVGSVVTIGPLVGFLLSEPSSDYAVCIMFIAGFLGFLLLGGAFASYMRHPAVIFHEKGIWQRTFTGKVREIRDEEIMDYWISYAYRHAHIGINTAFGPIFIGRECKGYREAQEWVRKKYKEVD